jgi:hypothetical protein
MKTHKRAIYKDWLKHEYSGPRNLDDEATLLQVAAAYDAVQHSGRLTKGQLQKIVNGASSKKMLVWSNSVDLLNHISVQFGEAADAVIEMSKSKQAHVRFNALCSLGRNTPTAVVDAVIRSGLVDKSSRVRWKAADRAHQLKRIQLVPELTAAIQVERDAKTRSAMAFDLSLLRDGFILKKADSGNFDLTVSYPGGIMGKTVSARDVRSQGIEAIVAKILRDRVRR